ncbi:hypothetical protein PTSG_01559 [Salpingoeca rosetta]|uniref:PhoD-like phosphatase metallophosphatase domain-containing protein n=1 Tax=Salpingoeca rosetta (strain ATCC 50818 / BSB-021) TaxID=946362 RepID=F2U0P9_SALR5|nr:uncharacterized protein PTSG_01559 [Salpingoeca rosetta]EGD80977.1 hypothetical protein PTSG_01559 [Salpingoeca rosetta]|eukprot:XP_004997538.1 hypothetical protein PTSG_01559 [Salpingoeca rosetta]
MGRQWQVVAVAAVLAAVCMATARADPRVLAAKEVESFLLANGRVTTTSARVLYDILLDKQQEAPPQPNTSTNNNDNNKQQTEEQASDDHDHDDDNTTANIKNDGSEFTLYYKLTTGDASDGGSVVARGTLDTTRLPNALVLNKGLRPCSKYTLAVTDAHGITVGVSRIHTECPGRDMAMDAVVVSCDRYLEDHDDEFVALLDASLTGNETMFHIGDQLYLDLPRKALAHASFPEAYQHVRRLYHKSWTRPAMASILRKASHIMLPDDHDIFNALSPGVLKTHAVDMAFIKAAHLAVLLFQRQLSHDIVLDVEALLRGEVDDTALFAHTTVDDALVSNGVGVFLLDLRYHRALAENEAHPTLVGTGQLARFTSTIEAWRQDKDVSNILVLTNLPLMYPNTFMADIVEVVEHDLYPNHRSYHASEDALLSPLFRAAREKHVTIAAGDLHMTASMTMCQRIGSDDTDDDTNHQHAHESTTTTSSSSSTTTTCIPALVSSSITKGSEGIRGFIITLFDSLVLLAPWPTFSVEDRHYSLRFHDMKLINNFLRITVPTAGAEPTYAFTVRQHNWAFMLYHNVMLHTSVVFLLGGIAFLLFVLGRALVRCCCCPPRPAKVKRQ